MRDQELFLIGTRPLPGHYESELPVCPLSFQSEQPVPMLLAFVMACDVEIHSLMSMLRPAQLMAVVTHVTFVKD